MALPANEPTLTREAWIAAQLAEQDHAMERLRDIYPDPLTTLGELIVDLFGTDMHVLDPVNDDCYMNDLCRADDPDVR